ncbi:MAG: hypothetical protein ACFCUN_02260 [Hyphomicrobiaceae bacterium]
MRRGMRVAFLAAVTLICVAFAGLAPVRAAPFKDYEGRYEGWGVMRLANGQVERIRCIADYMTEAAGTELRQALRCASPSVRIEATGRMSAQGDGKVDGTWLEHVFNVRGTISGLATDQGFALTIVGPTFSAAMDVIQAGCRQSLSISPQGFNIDRISIGLSRC